MSGYFNGPAFVKNLVQLKEPMKFTISETHEERTAMFPVNSVLFVDSEVANRWTEEDKAEIIGINEEEHEKLRDQLEGAEELRLLQEADRSNFVSGDNQKARELKASLGL